MGHKRIILAGPGASGKDYMRKLLESRGFHYAVSYTTRPPRPGEVNGQDYFFITAEDCERMKRHDEFYEAIEFNGWTYGTSREQFDEDDVFIMTPSGIAHISPEERKNCFIMYFDIPEDIRRERLAKREMPGDTLERRLVADRELFADFTDYDMKITDPNF